MDSHAHFVVVHPKVQNLPYDNLPYASLTAVKTLICYAEEAVRVDSTATIP
jgi:hypothetical protein